MKWPFGITSRWRTALAGLSVAVAALLLAGTVLMNYDSQSYKAQKLSEVTAQSRILSASVTAALVFDDAKTVQENVDAIRMDSEINAVAVYEADGKLVGQSRATGATPVPPTGVANDAVLDGDFVAVSEAVHQGGELVGYVYLRSMTEPLIRRLSRYIALILLLVMGSLVVAVLVTAQAALRQTNAELTAANANLRVQVAERERAEEALRQAQKMEAVGQLTGGIAHDFNNMLAVIISSLSLLKRRAARGEQGIERYADSALEGAQRAAALTQRLLAFARRQPLNPEPVDPNRLVTAMSELLRRTLGETVQIETVLAGGIWKARADAHQLENAVVNLAVNSRDAMPDGGRLTIETANIHLDEKYGAAHSGIPEGQYVMIAVSDTGGGMPPDVIEHAFEPFFTTKGVGKGTGLGLSQVYGFVRQSGGHVKIYSEIGHGTTVKLYFPRFIGTIEPEARVPEAEAVIAPTGVTILVVEDEVSVRRLAIEALTELGYRAIEAGNPAAALTLLEKHPEIRLLFTDIVMPEVNGRVLADEAIRRHPGLKVLFTTGYTRNAVVHNGVVDAGVHLLSKPFSLEQLASKVKAALDGSN